MNGQPNPTENVETEFELAARESLVAKYEALEVLKDDTTPAGKAFKTLVLDGYLKEKAIEYTSLLATEYVKKSGIRGHIMEELVAISAFEQYLLDVEALGAPVFEDDTDELEG
jgi:hypothetical protein